MTELDVTLPEIEPLKRITPGQILKAARENYKMEPDQVAKKLRLSISVIKDIEADDYEHFSAFIYLQGHLKAYARLVGVAEEKILEALDAMGFVKQEDSMAKRGNANLSFPVYVQSHSRNYKLLKWVSLGILLLLILLVIFWWVGQEKRGDKVQATKTLTSIHPIIQEANSSVLIKPLPAINTTPISSTRPVGDSNSPALNGVKNNSNTSDDKPLSVHAAESSVSNDKNSDDNASQADDSSVSSQSSLTPNYVIEPVKENH